MDPISATAAAGGLTAVATALSKPANTFLEKIAGAAGIYFEPHRIIRAARAEAEADKIRAVGRIEVSDIEERALIRMVREQGRMQENLEAITGKAAEEIAPDAKPEEMDDDWIAHVFDRCRLVSDPEMQTLWAKVLAGEANRQGSFAKRTVDMVSSLEKKDAELFSNLCGFIWAVNSDTKRWPLIFDFRAEICKQRGIDFASLTHLESVGLLKFSTSHYNATFPSTFTVVGYRGRAYRLEKTGGAAPLILNTGHVLLTQAGDQLAKIASSEPITGLEDSILDAWRNRGLTINELRNVVYDNDCNLIHVVNLSGSAS